MSIPQSNHQADSDAQVFIRQKTSLNPSQWIFSKEVPTQEVVSLTKTLSDVSLSTDPAVLFRSLPLPLSLKFHDQDQGIEVIIASGDITTWSGTDGECTAVVNAANEYMCGGGGVDGAIHRAAGRSLLNYCKKMPQIQPGVRCPTGEAQITPSFKMSQVDRIIHTVGPVYNGSKATECKRLLQNAYRNSLTIASKNGVKHVAFPALSCGVFGYPLNDAAVASLEVIQDFDQIQRQNKVTPINTASPEDPDRLIVPDKDQSVNQSELSPSIKQEINQTVTETKVVATSEMKDNVLIQEPLARGEELKFREEDVSSTEKVDSRQAAAEPETLTQNQMEVKRVTFVLFGKETANAWLDSAQRLGMTHAVV